MRHGWREHEEALEEFRRAAWWYEERRVGLGEAFMDAVDTAIESILDPSIQWGFYRGRRSAPQVYSRSIAGFPYHIIYLELDEEIYVVAYAHEPPAARILE